MPAGVIIGLSLGFMIFAIVSTIVCMKRRANAAANVGHVINTRAPVVVTSATHTAPGGYPVTTPLPAATYQTSSYGAPYPAQTTGPNVTVQMQMPMPMPGAQPGAMPGMQPHVAPYPPVAQHQYPGAGAANMNPPSYDMAMSNNPPTVVPPGYEKQMPYNPNY